MARAGRGMGGGGAFPVALPPGGGGEGGGKSLPPIYWSPTGAQPTACTLALWWLNFGPTGVGSGGWVGGWLSHGPKTLNPPPRV